MNRFLRFAARCASDRFIPYPLESGLMAFGQLLSSRDDQTYGNRTSRRTEKGRGWPFAAGANFWIRMTVRARKLIDIMRF